MVRLTPGQYEDFIASLVAKLEQLYQVEDIGFGQKNRLQGKSGIDHQIDVSFIDKSKAAPILVIIECKNLKAVKPVRSVKLEHVKILKATIEDLTGHPRHPGIVQGHLVSTTPAQSGAKDYASFYGISLQIVSAGPNWGFRYGSMLQVGLALQGEASILCGTATISRKCVSCNQMFCPQGSEVVCQSCASLPVNPSINPGAAAR